MSATNVPVRGHQYVEPHPLQDALAGLLALIRREPEVPREHWCNCDYGCEQCVNDPYILQTSAAPASETMRTFKWVWDGEPYSGRWAEGPTRSIWSFVWLWLPLPDCYCSVCGADRHAWCDLDKHEELEPPY